MGNLPIGQGEAVTPMQIAQFYGAIANGGVLRTPHLVRRIDGRLQSQPAARRIMSAATAASLRTMLEGVLAPGGTASEVAPIKGYTLAGKTGTANKIDPVTHEYSQSDYVASFVGFAPAQNPKLLISIMVDEPKGAIYGGQVAAPAFGKIASFALRYQKIPPSEVAAGLAMVAAMLLGDLFADPALPDVDVAALAYDARAVTPGSVFFCVRGFTADGHRYAPEAVANGAVALVVDHPLDLGVPEVLVDDVRAAMAPAAARLAGDPTAELAMVGITGTNGKTTTSYLTRALLEASGRQTGLIGTVTSWVGGAERPVVRTTPEAIDLQPTFRAMRDGHPPDVAAVMEVSSHALSLHRADAIHWDVAAFTNLTQDHLDFHTDMEDYFLAKRRLFEVAAEQGATLIACVDDPYGARLARGLPAGGDDRDRRGRRVGARDRPASRARRRPTSRSTARRSARRCPGASTSSTRSSRWPPRARWASTTRRSPPRCPVPAACPGASSRSTRARSSRSSSTTRTSPTRSTTSCAPRASWPRAT